MSIGKIGPFNPGDDNWALYVERLEQFFIVNDIKEALKVPTLITVMGAASYELLVTLVTPERPARMSFAQLTTAMKTHLQPEPSELAERYRFRQRTQQRTESVAEFLADLKNLSKFCKFGKGLDENLRDQLVCGLKSELSRQRIFAEEGLTFEKAWKLAVTMEAAEASAAVVEGRGRDRGDGGASSSAVCQAIAGEQRGREGSRAAPVQQGMGHKAGVGASRTPRWQGRRAEGAGWSRADGASAAAEERGQRVCQVCGGKHSDNTCKFRKYICRVCNQEGHLKKMCPRIGKVHVGVCNNNWAVKEVTYQSDSSDSGEVHYYSYIKTNRLELYRPYIVVMNVNGINLSMELDTGSTISCISYECYLQLFPHCKLIESNLMLRYYTGELIKTLGKITPIVKYENKIKRLDLYVVKEGKTVLLGRQWLYELDMDVSPSVNCCSISKEDNKFSVETLSYRFCNVFEDGLGCYTGDPVGLRVRPDARPVFMRARPLAYALREPVERALDSLVRDGIITPVETSDWATPIVPVVKTDGSIRICGDFKLTLNKYLEVDRFPLPRVEDLLTKLHGGEKFSKLDLSQAYAQMELDEESKRYTVINTHRGLFKYNRLIYGLSSSPGIFQRILEQMFSDMPKVGVFLDDVILTGRDDKEHLDVLYQVLERLQKWGLKVKKEKCTFFADSVTYLGYNISKTGVHTCLDKIEAIRKVPVPTNVSELRSFLGMVMYYAKFVRNISMILTPLYNLLKKNFSFNWNEDCDRAFNEVKEMLISSEVLAHYSPDLPLVLTTDASSVGVGAVISHLMEDGSERPIAYASRTLNDAERGYSQIDREALAIIFGVRKFHQYLYGRKFTLRTDHKPLVSIFGQKAGIPTMAASRMQRWAILLSGYDYDIEYVSTDKNSADALSRLPIGKRKALRTENTYLNFVQNFLPLTKETIREAVKSDVTLQKIMLYIRSGWPTNVKEEELKPYFLRKNELYLESGCIMWGYRMVIPISLREKVLKELHVGHMGVVKMKGFARSYVWWPGIDAAVESTCKECSTCTAEAAAPPRAPPQPWPYTTEPWSRLHVDFLGPFQEKTFFVLVDSSSKWIEAFQMQRTTAIAVIKILRETFARFGLPKELVSDNGPPFTSREFGEFLKNNGIKQTFTPVYHPSSNGAAENAVKLCKRAVKKAVRDKIDIDAALQAYLLAYRNAEHSTTGDSPARLLQKRNLRSRLDVLCGDRSREEKVREAQDRQVAYAGGRKRDLQVGDRVWAREYGGRDKWQGGSIAHRVGSRNYIVQRENGQPMKRHVDQLRRRSHMTHVPCPSTTSPMETTDDVREVPGLAPSEGTSSHERVISAIQPPATPLQILNRPRRDIKPVKRYGFEID